MSHDYSYIFIIVGGSVGPLILIALCVGFCKMVEKQYQNTPETTTRSMGSISEYPEQTTLGSPAQPTVNITSTTTANVSYSMNVSLCGSPPSPPPYQEVQSVLEELNPPPYSYQSGLTKYTQANSDSRTTSAANTTNDCPEEPPPPYKDERISVQRQLLPSSSNQPSLVNNSQNLSSNGRQLILTNTSQAYATRRGQNPFQSSNVGISVPQRRFEEVKITVRGQKFSFGSKRN